MSSPTAKIRCIYGIYLHRLVIEGVATIVYAIIVRTFTGFKSSAWTKLARSKKIARVNINFNTNTSYFSMLNQIANLQIRDFAKASSLCKYVGKRWKSSVDEGSLQSAIGRKMRVPLCSPKNNQR